MADTVTKLNKETVAGGDAMDESLVPNTAGPGGLAKRPRVVIGGDDGELVDVATEGGIVKLQIKAESLPLPAGAGTEATLAAIKAKTDNLDVALSTRTKPADQQHVLVDNLPATQPVSGPLTNAELRATPVSTRLISTTASRTTVPAALTDTLLLSENANRKTALIYNNSNAILYIGLGADPVYADDFSYLIAADTLWEIPVGYTGEVRGYWSSVDGKARMTELV